MKHYIKYILGFAALLLLVYLSLDIRKLDLYLAARPAADFDAGEYALEVWENKIPEAIRNAPDLGSLAESLRSNPEQAFQNLGRKLGISETWYFIAKGKGTVESVEEEFILVSMEQGMQAELATAFIFGNAIRDGSGVVDIDEFVNMTDFNNVSIALNKRVKEEVVPLLLGPVRAGMSLEFTGAFELHEDQALIRSVRIIPLAVNLSGDGR